MNHPNQSLQLLEEFLRYPLHTTDEIFERFESIPGAICGKGDMPLQRYVCIPGTRKSKIVLVAHADTVWDEAYGRSATTEIQFADGIFKSVNPTCGLGADDRAGCAMLWALRNSGHTILLVNGEENGKHGANFLRDSNPKLFRFLNSHQFMIELDYIGTNTGVYNQVDFTKRFRNYISKNLGFHDDGGKGGCDLQILCHKICGVNVGIGYHNPHKAEEYLSLDEWENAFANVVKFLEMQHPKFPISLRKRIRKVMGRMKKKCMEMLKQGFRKKPQK